MAQATKDTQSTSPSPIIWVIIAIIALIMVFVFFSGRSGTATEKISLEAHQNIPGFSGEITRSEPVVIEPPELNARDLIRETREKGNPYPLDELYQKALSARAANDMENAHLLFFFSAREGHLPSILMMGEMADPLLFNTANSLLDQADPIQAYKWYRIALQRNNADAQLKMDNLKQWAKTQASFGNETAQQLLLNFSQ